ncbi:MAG: septal ring lytic transglycosylase RlpA family protein [Candidatus Abyssobacteria bacterium SURF_5]|uniref:Probable endolytic peptidoglycan transglycosylase RlpA n=1 Tax=Abyssobacteria bacterium (strain SURF_5) TaxID=2093360 RepID=A0A3A4NR96_ABYX5|nr:MAG: septal ring lytic transglycosylase RlpA family protein [Candidatus Abyssubacteria bacterium SURF_5]
MVLSAVWFVTFRLAGLTQPSTTVAEAAQFRRQTADSESFPLMDHSHRLEPETQQPERAIGAAANRTDHVTDQTIRRDPQIVKRIAPFRYLLGEEPLAEPRPFKIIYGIASWYGPRFHGRTTANGERYDMFAYTAAHRTLPFGTSIRVTNVRNGRQTVIRINDRGPFIDGREIDLSYRAAQVLDMVDTGLEQVRLEIQRSGDEFPPRFTLPANPH